MFLKGEIRMNHSLFIFQLVLLVVVFFQLFTELHV